MAFRPADGEKSRRKKVVDLTSMMGVGDFVSYEELGALIGVTDNHSVQSAVSVANRELRRWHSKMMSSSPGKGYVIVGWSHHDPEMGRQEKERIRAYFNYYKKDSAGIVDLLGDSFDSVCADIERHRVSQLRRLTRYGILKRFDPAWEETLRVGAEYLRADLGFRAAMYLRLWDLDHLSRRRVVEWFLGTG